MQNKEQIVQAWLTKAEHDLGTAKITLLHLPEYTDTICFHCQKAVEKYLKVYLIYLDTEFSFYSLSFLYSSSLLWQQH